MSRTGTSESGSLRTPDRLVTGPAVDEDEGDVVLAVVGLVQLVALDFGEARLTEGRVGRESKPGRGCDENEQKRSRSAQSEYEGVFAKVFRPEHIIAVAASVGRHKDLARVEHLLNRPRLTERSWTKSSSDMI